MAKSYSDLWKMADDLKKEGSKVTEKQAQASKLPYDLQEEFRKSQDPKLNEAINKAQSDTFGAAIKGLDMYQNISNPFTRRNLAEQYQGGIEQGWKNLTDERTRRQGVYADYIQKWTGLFGAEAAKSRDDFNNKMSMFNTYKNLADTEESNRRWNIENARNLANTEESNRRWNIENARRDWTDQEIRSFVYSHKDTMPWEDQANYLAEKGVDVTTGGVFDVTANEAWETGNHPVKHTSENELSFTEKLDGLKYEEAVSKGNGTKENPYSNPNDAQVGQYYTKNGKIYKSVNWAVDEEVN